MHYQLTRRPAVVSVCADYSRLKPRAACPRVALDIGCSANRWYDELEDTQVLDLETVLCRR